MHIDRPITIALIIVVTFLLVFFLVLPQYNNFIKLQSQLGQKQAEYRAQVDYYATIYKAYYELQQHKDELKEVDDALPEGPVLGNLIYFLQQNAKMNGLIVKDLFLSQSSGGNSKNSAESAIKDIVFSADLLGDYSSLGGFLLSLEGSSRIFETSSISFGSATGPPYSFSLQIKTHSY